MLKGDHSSQRRQEKTLPEKDAAQKTQEGWPKRLLNWVLADPPLYIRYFFPILVTLGIIGGIVAIWVPVGTGWLRQEGLQGEAEQKSISDLRLHFLYITGGTIAILTLLQTNWKNYNDNKKNMHDIEMDILKSEREDDSKWREISDDRRRKFNEFKEGVTKLKTYEIDTFIDFANTWLQKSPDGREDDVKYEAQRVIDTLCRLLKSQENKSADNITYTLQKLSSIYENAQNDSLWRSVSYRFSGLEIQKPLQGLYLHNIDFSESTFSSEVGFVSCTFSGRCSFWRSHFEKNFYINSSEVNGSVSFISSEFLGNFTLSRTAFTHLGSAEFMNATFFRDATFEYTKFPQEEQIGLNHSFSKTYFSNSFIYTFENNTPKIRTANRTFNGKHANIPIESILFDSETGDSEF